MHIVSRPLLVIAMALLAIAATSAEAAYILNDTPFDVTVTKSGGNFVNTKIMTTLTREQAAQIANYTQFVVDVTLSDYQADGNLGIATNSSLTGYQSHDPHPWFNSQDQREVIVWDYSTDTAFKDAAAAWAAGDASWREVMLESNWPAYTASNVFTVNSIYLDGEVPEPASLTLLTAGSFCLLRRRRNPAAA